jgi:hypothetical protein
VAWALLVAINAAWLHHVGRASSDSAPGGKARTGPGGSRPRALVAVAALVLLLALGLERMTPGARTRPAWPGAIPLDAEATLFLEGPAVVREDEAVIGPGAVELLVRAPEARTALEVTVGGSGGVLHAAGRLPLALRPTGATLELPLSAYHEVRGRADRQAAFTRAHLWLDQEAVLRVAR